jgi:CubicO group peptidase (beta-lactamase class C family)
MTIRFGLRHLPALLLGLSLTACTTAHLPQPTPSADGAKAPVEARRFEWRTSTPEAQGVDSRSLAQVLRRVVQQDIDLHGLIVYRNGHIILEVYPPPYDAQTVHNLKSVSKSLLSALVGIAIDEGFIDSVDQRVADFFPDYADALAAPGKKDITIRQLLTMTAGLELDENGPLMQGVFSSGDWIGATLRRPKMDPAGQRFLYSTALTHLMSGLLSRASDSSLFDLCQRYLCGPLEFEEMQWRKGPSGYYFGGAELYLRPRDLLKFGLLYLNGGQWQGRQLVPRSWVQESTRDQLGQIADRPPDGYGYWWWPVGKGYAGRGWGGQRLLVRPDKNLVIAATFADPDGFKRIFSNFDMDRLAETPLAPNPAAYDELLEAVKELEHPPSRPVPALPDMARAISGKAFGLQSETGTPAIKYISFDFTRTGDFGLSIDTGSTSRRLALGLDSRFRITPTGEFGPLPVENRIALRGLWLDDTRFELEYLWVGEPFRTTFTFGFGGDHVVIEGRLQPAGVDLNLEGVLSDRRIVVPATQLLPGT